MATKHSPIEYLIGGATCGFCIVLVGHPFDTIKVYLQTSPSLYRNMFHVARSVIAKEGPFSLYKGMSAPLTAVVPLSAVSFFSYGAGKHLFGDPGQVDLNDVQLLLAGTFSGFCTTIVTAPGERIKCLLQAQEEKKYGFRTYALKLWREGGIKNIYLGTGATLIRDMPGCAIYYFAYERIMGVLLGTSTRITWQPILAGGVAGTLMWLFCLPADALKTRIQISSIGQYPRGVRSVFPIIMKEGILTLYRGMVPVMMRAFAANGACFYGLELSFMLMDKLKRSYMKREKGS